MGSGNRIIYYCRISAVSNEDSAVSVVIDDIVNDRRRGLICIANTTLAFRANSTPILINIITLDHGR